MLIKRLEQLASDQTISDFLVKEKDSLWVRSTGTLQRNNPNEKVSRKNILELLAHTKEQTGFGPEDLDAVMDNSGDKDFAIRLGEKRFRVNLYWSDGQLLTMALRRLPDKAPELPRLGLPESYMGLLKNSRGLILVTGATGSGKSTTLASTLEYLNEFSTGHIITLEDPVEYQIQSKNCLVDQRQVGRDVSSFGDGLRAALRQDPDILLVGELRDYETVKTALDAANTGHLVFGTLHTNSAQQTIERVTSFFPDESRDWAHTVLSQALLGIISQVLIPKKTSGRALCAEILVNQPDVKQIIREGRSHQLFNAMDTGGSKGQVLMNRVLKSYVKNGIITEEAALGATYDAAGLRKELERG
ncbi:PilT/PilU family type 4a pilus ATPase [Nostoc sp. CHAB 5834]|nr:PilT/PilU family type 4a pilus ATPase [Nostoc sp. CHAB 5834]